MRILAAIGALAIVVAIAASVYLFGGFYNVAASQPDSGLVVAALTRVREASMGRRATAKPPIALDDPAIIQAGARAFAARGCSTCHGAPGVDWAKFAEGLRPDPADLNEVGKDDPPAQIFWVIKNGINMTGMPSFERAKVPDDEIWKIVAFIKKLPNVKPEDYKAWSAGAAP